MISDFIQMGLVSETDTVSTSENGLGRKGLQLRLNKNAFSTIGIFFEGNHLRVGLMNLLHEVIDCIDYFVQADPSTPEEYEAISKRMTNAIDTLILAHPTTKVLGVGIGMPGIIDAKNNTFMRWGKLYNFYDLYKSFRQNCALPVFIENDMNAASLGETILRNNPAFSNLFFLSVGTGTGAGIIINDHIWHGNGNYAGDVGLVMNDLKLSAQKEDLVPLRLNNQICASAIERRFQVDIAHNIPCSKEKKQEISEYIVSRVLPMVYNLNYILDISNYVLSGSVIDFLGDTIFDCLNQSLEHLKQIDMFPMQLNIIPSIHCDVGIVGAADIALCSRLPDILSL